MYLDEQRIESPGKFEGESEAARYIYDASLEGGADDEFSHDSLGWYALYITSLYDGDRLKYRAYIMHEADNGFVSIFPYSSPDEARQNFQKIADELSTDGEC